MLSDGLLDININININGSDIQNVARSKNTKKPSNTTSKFNNIYYTNKLTSKWFFYYHLWEE